MILYINRFYQKEEDKLSFRIQAISDLLNHKRDKLNKMVGGSVQQKIEDDTIIINE